MPNDDLPDWLRTIAACVLLLLIALFGLVFIAWFAKTAGVL